MWGAEPFMPVCGGVGSNNPADPSYPLDSFNAGGAAMTFSQLSAPFPPVNQDWDLASLPAFGSRAHGWLVANGLFLWKGSTHLTAGFEVASWLATKRAQQLHTILPGLPARPADQDAYLAGEAVKYPWVTNWDVLPAAVDYADGPAPDGWMPNPEAARIRLQEFGAEISCNPAADVRIELERLQQDLQMIFNQ
jgi:hypothetical protein